MKNYSSDNFMNASWKGKDLLEATGQHAKSSLEFKTIMSRLLVEVSSIDEKDVFNTVNNSVKDFAYLIYGDNKRAEIFTEQVMLVFCNQQ